jgi:hypothetical protein
MHYEINFCTRLNKVLIEIYKKWYNVYYNWKKKIIQNVHKNITRLQIGRYTTLIAISMCHTNYVLFFYRKIANWIQISKNVQLIWLLHLHLGGHNEHYNELKKWQYRSNIYVQGHLYANFTVRIRVMATFLNFILDVRRTLFRNNGPLSLLQNYPVEKCFIIIFW